MRNPHKDNIVKMLEGLCHCHSPWTVFSDFVELYAISISNPVDKRQFDVREERYLATIKRYTPDEQQKFPQMFAELVLALEREATDILGVIFHELNLHNHYKGQFFTPQHMCDFMAAMTIDRIDDEVAERGYISLSEPACGSGVMILGAIRTMAKKGLNYQRQLFVEACDIDLKCVHMTYVQLALCGVPAVVLHGNTLTQEVWSHWHTPMYVLDGWVRKIGK